MSQMEDAHFDALARQAAGTGNAVYVESGLSPHVAVDGVLQPAQVLCGQLHAQVDGHPLGAQVKAHVFAAEFLVGQSGDDVF